MSWYAWSRSDWSAYIYRSFISADHHVETQIIHIILYQGTMCFQTWTTASLARQDVSGDYSLSRVVAVGLSPSLPVTFSFPVPQHLQFDAICALRGLLTVTCSLPVTHYVPLRAICRYMNFPLCAFFITPYSPVRYIFLSHTFFPLHVVYRFTAHGVLPLCAMVPLHVISGLPLHAITVACYFSVTCYTWFTVTCPLPLHALCRYTPFTVTGIFSVTLSWWLWSATGELPELEEGQLSELQFLRMRSNKISGELSGALSGAVWGAMPWARVVGPVSEKFHKPPLETARVFLGGGTVWI